MSKTSDNAGTMSAQEAAKLLMLESTRRIQQLAAEGYIQKAGHDRYFTVSVVQGYIRFLKEDKVSKAQGAADVRMKDARTRNFEIRNAQADNSLIDLTEAEAVIDEISSMLKLGLEGVAGAVTRDLPLRRKIEAAIDDVFARTSARIAEALTALATSGEAVEADAEDDA